MPKNTFKPMPAPKTVSAYPAHTIAKQFGNVKPSGETEGFKAERDMYEVDRSEDFMAKNPYGITHGQKSF